MFTGVQAVVLAAAATALPFAPPAGWVELPQSAVGVHVTNVWNGPKAVHGTPASFSTVTFPFPGTAEMLAGGGGKALAKAKSIKTLSNTAVNLCGTHAHLVTRRVEAGGTSGILQQEIAVKGGFAYLLMYTRPATAPADPRIGAVMRTFCPSGTPKIATLKMPEGWTATGGDMQMLGMWMGTQPGQMMMLMRGTQMSSLDQLLTDARKKALKSKSVQSLVKVTMHKAVTMCGHPGMLVDMHLDAAPMKMAMHMALTQGNGASYVLSYMQVGSAPADPAALAALNTLCLTGASPAPDTSPSPAAIRLRALR